MSALHYFLHSIAARSSRYGCMVMLLSVVLLVWPSIAMRHAQAAQSKQTCLTFYKAKKFVKAAECFAEMFQQAPSAPQKAMWCWNTGLTYRRAADLTANTEKKQYLRIKAQEYFQQFIDGKLARTPTQHKLATQVVQNLTQQIGKTTLHIQSDGEALIKVSRRQFIRTANQSWTRVDQEVPGLGRGQWKEQVFPGTFTITVTYPPTRIYTETVIVKPNTPERIDIVKPAPTEPRTNVPERRPAAQRQAPRPKAPPRLITKRHAPATPPARRVASVPIKLVLWNPVSPPSRAATMISGLLIGGGIMVIAGGGAFMLLNLDLGDIDKKLGDDPEINKNNILKHREDLRSRATRNIIIGVAVMSVGALITILGITNYALSHGSAAPPKLNATSAQLQIPLTPKANTTYSFVAEFAQ